MKTHTRLQYSLLAMAVAAAYPLHATAAATAGTAQFIAGEVNVRRGDGSSNPLVKGKELESGESIVTGTNGRAQVKWTDGGLLSLQPNTEFKITNYVDQADPKQDRFLVDLLRGSMRAITGLIGKRNKDNYKVTTTTATIGIRGSGFTAGYNPDGSLSVTTELDAIEVCNSGGCVGLTAGESARITSSTEAPQRVGTRAALPTPGTTQSATVAGNQTNSDGTSSIIPSRRIYTDLSVGTVYSYSYNGQPNVASPYVNNPTTVPDEDYQRKDVLSSISGGKLTEVQALALAQQIYGGYTSSNGYTDTSPATSTAGSLGNPSDADYLGWGTWATGINKYASGEYVVNTDITAFSYILGRPTLAANMPAAGLRGNYSLAGGTAWSTVYNKGQLLDTSKMMLDFGSGIGSGSIDLYARFTGTEDVHINADIYSSGSTISSSQPRGGSFVGYDSEPPKTLIEGFFAGPTASRAAVVYSSRTEGAGTVSGAAAFQQLGSLSPTPVPQSSEALAIQYQYPSDGVVSRFHAPSLYDSITTNLLQGKLTDFSWNRQSESTVTANGYDASPSTSFGSSAGNITDADYVGWGTWTQGALVYNTVDQGINVMSYIVGKPAGEYDGMVMPSSGMTGKYSLLGGTAYSSVYAKGDLLPTSNMTVFFGAPYGGGTIDLYANFKNAGADVPVHISSGITIEGSGIYNGGDANTYINGFFIGDNAYRAGVTYSAETGETAGIVSGAAAFQQSEALKPGMMVAGRYVKYGSDYAVTPAIATPSRLDDMKLTSFTAPNYGDSFAAKVPGESCSPTIIEAGFIPGTTAGIDFIGWGRWTEGTRKDQYGSEYAITNLHYLVGDPTVSMPLTGEFNYIYATGNGTNPTYNGTSGTLNSATLTANFGGTGSIPAGTVNATVVTSFNTGAGNELKVTGMAIAGSAFKGGTSVGGSYGTIEGFFSGANAARAGISYNGSVTGGSGNFSGVAVLTKQVP